MFYRSIRKDDDMKTITKHETTEITPAGGPVTAYPVNAYLATLPSANSRRAMENALDTIAGLISGGTKDARGVMWQSLRYEHTVAIYSKLMERYKPATVNQARAALRGVLKACETLGLMDYEQYRRAIDLKPVKGDTLPAGREITPAELAALLGTCWEQSTPAGVRDAAVISVMYACGVRRDELARLAVGDYDPETGRLVIVGKGRKERLAFLTNGAKDALCDWLGMRGAGPGALFCRVDKWEHIYPAEHLTGDAVYKMLQGRGSRAGLEHFTPHDLRRSCVSAMLDAGIDVVTVSRVVGHSDPRTTARYDRRKDESLKAASAALTVPYRKK